MELIWAEYDKHHNGGGKAKYEVYVSVSYYNKKWHLRISFANKGYRVASAYGRLIHTEIMPNSTRIYLNFIPKETNDIIGRTLSKPQKKSELMVATFPLSKIKAEIVRGKWIGCYKLEYDADNHYYYIDINTKKER